MVWHLHRARIVEGYETMSQGPDSSEIDLAHGSSSIRFRDGYTPNSI